LGALGVGAQGLESRTESNRPFSLPSPLGPLRSEEAEGGRYRFWPRSAPVERGVEYAFEVGHCGLEFLTDFDGSFWRPIPPGEGVPPSVFINSDVGVGTMVLVEENRALYATVAGSEIRLRRIAGPVVAFPCE
jgi:hypothetical protein